MSEQATPEYTAPFDLPGALDVLGQWMQKADGPKARLAVIKEAAELLSEPFKAELDGIEYEIATLRNEIEAEMERAGIRTQDGDGIQAQRPKSTKLTVVNRDIATAHLADLGRLEDVTVTYVDEKKLLEFAKAYPEPIEGVEEVTTFGFKIVQAKR